MKVILSRKGMDSAVGGIASPILPNGTLLSLPIPEQASDRTYAQLNYYGESYEEIIHQLSPKFDFSTKGSCHLDPDIYDNINIVDRPDDWEPAFGQCAASAKHLDNMGVDVGDIFLFYGMFRQTEYTDHNKLRYVRGASIQHIIFGYLKVGEVLRDINEIKRRYSWHPHAVNAERVSNRLYLPCTYGTLIYNKKLLLSKEGQPQRRLWQLPLFFAESGIEVSWQGTRRPVRCGNYSELSTACRGQEFVISVTGDIQEKNLKEWVDNLLKPELRKQMVNHIQYPDKKGRVYCRKENDVKILDFDRCMKCPLVGGSAQGEGIECYYEDAFFDNMSFIQCRGGEHQKEKTRIDALIKDGVLGKTAVRK